MKIRQPMYRLIFRLLFLNGNGVQSNKHERSLHICYIVFTHRAKGENRRKIWQNTQNSKEKNIEKVKNVTLWQKQIDFGRLRIYTHIRK